MEASEADSPVAVVHGVPLPAPTAQLVQFVANNVIGDDDIFTGPYGDRKLTYVDYTASGRCLRHIEEYIQGEVLPMYGNSHSSVSQCAYQSTSFREEARALIKDRVRATDRDAIIFCGSGATAGFDKLVHILGLTRGGDFSPSSLPSSSPLVCAFPSCGRTFVSAANLRLHQRTHRDGDFHSVAGLHEREGGVKSSATVADPTGEAASSSRRDAPLVIVGPYAHHSNLLPWTESLAEVVFVPEAAGSGGVDMQALKKLLEANKHRPRIIGAFTAASNITGATVDVDAVNRLMHMHKAIVVWDYAAAAPHLPIDMNPPHPSPEERALVSKDAVVFSPHKLVGGPGATGILIVKRALFRDAEPSTPGGGTVFFVRPDGSARYTAEEAEREEGGTPNVIGCVRVGLVMQLQYAVGYGTIDALESAMAEEARRRWAAHPNIAVIGDSAGKRVSIVSFQCRGGCLCAGPYAMELLGINKSQATALENQLLEKDEMLRPGFVRLSFPYHMPRDAFEFVVATVLWTADNGHRFLHQYSAFADTGEWKHKSIGAHPRPRRWLNSIRYENGTCTYPTERRSLPSSSSSLSSLYSSYMAAAVALLAELGEQKALARALRESVGASGLLTPAGEGLRWFTVPGEVVSNTPTALPLRHSLARMVSTSALLPPAPVPSAPLEPAVASEPSQSSQSVVEGDEEDGFPSFGVMDDDVDEVDTAPADAGDVRIELGSQQSSAPLRFEMPRKGKEPLGQPLLPSAGTDGFGMPCNPAGLESFSRALEETVTTGVVKAIRPTAKLLSLIGKAMGDFNMINPGDRLLLGLSGGKDSMTLLHYLIDFQKRSKIPFTLAACTVDPQAAGFRPEPLKQYLARLGIPYFFESVPIIEIAALQPKKVSSICAWCSRMKRGILYSTCRREGYNVLVLGQHLDDMAESFVMSAFYNGLLRTMKANYTIGKGDLRVIRPLAYVRERYTRAFATEARLPIIEENCPACYDAPTVRYRVKTLLASQEHVNPPLFTSLKQAMRPLMSKHRLDGGDGEGGGEAEDDFE